MDHLSSAPTNAYEMKMDVQKGYSSKDIYGHFSSASPPISVAAPKPLSSNMDSRSVFPTKTPSFAYSNFYPKIPLNTQSPFGGVINFKDVTSSLSCGGYLLKVGSLSFGSPVSVTAIGKLIF